MSDPAPPALTALTEADRAEAHRRWLILQAHLEDGVALSQVAAETGIRHRTLQRWLARYRSTGLAGLARTPRADQGRSRCPGPLRLLIEGLALRKPATSAAHVHRQVTEVAEREGWAVPSYATVYAIIRDLDPALRTLAVEGSKRYAEVFELIYRRQAARPNEIWQADHTLLDLWVVTPSGKPGRPWLTVIEDDHSRAIAGYAVNLDAPSALQTALTLRQAIWRKSEPGWHVCGIPDAFARDSRVIAYLANPDRIFSYVWRVVLIGRVDARYSCPMPMLTGCRLPGAGNAGGSRAGGGPPTGSCATTTSATWPTAATRRPASAPTRSTSAALRPLAGRRGRRLDGVDTDGCCGICRVPGRAPRRRARQRDLAGQRPGVRVRPATINRRLAAISGLFSFRSMRDPAVVNPVPRGPAARRAAAGERAGLLGHLARPKPRSKLRVREPRRLPRGLDRAETAALLSSFRTDRDRAIAGLMLLSGLRSAEVLGLRVADVDIGRGWVRVTGKGDKECRVPLDPDVAGLIQSYLLAGRPETASRALFVVAKGPSRGSR